MIEVLPVINVDLPTPMLPKKTILYLMSHRLVLCSCIFLLVNELVMLCFTNNKPQGGRFLYFNNIAIQTNTNQSNYKNE